MSAVPGSQRNVPPGQQDVVEAAAGAAQPLRGLRSIDFLLPAGKTFRAPRLRAAAGATGCKHAATAADGKPFVPPRIQRLRKAFAAPRHRHMGPH
jgi:hypothetical protein